MAAKPIYRQERFVPQPCTYLLVQHPDVRIQFISSDLLLTRSTGYSEPKFTKGNLEEVVASSRL
jgi:hypothetical protein